MDQNTARSVAFQLLPNQSRSWADLARVVDERVLHQILRQFGVGDPSEVPQGRRAEWDEVLAAAHRTLAPTQTPLDWALAYAAAGWSVLPADPKTREPLMDLGVTHATTDPVSIRSWWAACPQAVPALGCKLSGVFAIDLDCKPGKTDGRTTWAGVTQGRALSGALVATTPSGGRHLIFRAPAGAPVKSPVEFWPGIDFKGGNGSGGYVLLPCGQGDRIWLQGDPRTDHAVEAPEWLVAIIPRRKEKEPEEIEEPARQPAREDLEDDLARAEWVLQHVFPDADALDYGQWLFRLMELASLGEKGVALAKAWNARGSRGKYNPSVDDARFGGFNGERQIASLFAAADEKAPGWRKAQKAEARTATSAAAFTPLGGSGSLFDDEGLGAAQDAPGSTKWRMRAWGEVCDDPPVDWLVDDLVPRGGLVVVGGEPSAGKTLLVLDAALRMAHGLPWLGKETKPASTLYLAGEGTPGLGARMRAWRAGNPDAKQIEGCYVALVDGVPNLAGLHAVTELLALMAQAQATYGKVPEVLVVDTLAMAAPGADENDAAAVGLVLRALAELRLRTGVTVELVHHTKKPQAGSGASSSLHALRGSSAIAGAADVVLLALVESDRKVLRTAKTRDGEALPGVQYRVVGQRTGRMRSDGRAEQGPVISQLVEAAPEIDAAAEEERNIARIVAAMDKLGTATRADTIVREAGMKLSVGRALLDKAAGRLLIKIDTVGRQKIYTSKMVQSPPHPPSLGRRGRPVGIRRASEDVLGTSGTSGDVRNESLLD